MVRLDSVRDRTFMHTSDAPHKKAETMVAIAPKSISINPGRGITMAPAKPNAIAVMRRARITSPRKRAAINVLNSGPVKFNAATVANGVTARA